MPPVGFFAAATSSYTSASGAVSFFTPPATRENDVLLALIAVPSGGLVLPSGWTQLASIVGTDATLFVCRRIAVLDEPATHVFTCSTGLTNQPLGAVVLWRGLDPAAAIVASAIASVHPGTAYNAPAITLVTYSDLGVLVYYEQDGAGTATFTMPGGATQRAIVHGSSGGGTFVLADYLQEATGTTGSKNSTASVSANGIAVNLACKALPTMPAPALVPDIPGTIGLPTVGV